jgi:hypothetical protein
MPVWQSSQQSVSERYLSKLSAALDGISRRVCQRKRIGQVAYARPAAKEIFPAEKFQKKRMVL